MAEWLRACGCAMSHTWRTPSRLPACRLNITDGAWDDDSGRNVGGGGGRGVDSSGCCCCCCFCCAVGGLFDLDVSLDRRRVERTAQASTTGVFALVPPARSSCMASSTTGIGLACGACGERPCDAVPGEAQRSRLACVGGLRLWKERSREMGVRAEGVDEVERLRDEDLDETRSSSSIAQDTEPDASTALEPSRHRPFTRLLRSALQAAVLRW